MNTKPILFVGLLLKCACSVSAAQTYHLTDLGTLGGNYSYANDLNASGQVVGYADVDGSNHAFRYSNGSMTDLGSGVAVGIDSSGDVAGTNGIYSNGSWAVLPDGSVPFGVNSAGDVVGNTSVTGHAFLYRNGLLIDLANRYPSQLRSTAVAINSCGQLAVGWADAGVNDQGNSTTYAFMYIIGNGGVGDLFTLGGTMSYAHAVNDDDQIVGESYLTGNSEDHAFLYNYIPGTTGNMQDLGTLGGYLSVAESINGSGEIVGSSSTSGGTGEHAFLYSNGMMLDVNGMLDASGEGWTVIDADGINDLGLICGAGIDPNGDTHELLLTPVVPEPSCILIVGITIMSVVLPRRTQIGSGH